jgi:pimeloyl-ACP methyl ester carboxylesterase
LRARVTDPAGQALMAFIENKDRERFDTLYAALPEQMRRDMEGMDPSRLDLSQLKARLILVHGLGDDIIPYVESLGLHRAAPAGQSRLYRVKGLNHVTMGKPGLLDVLQMLSAVTALLRERA